MSPELLARLFQERSQTRMIRFDESVVPRTTPGDLDYALTRRFLQDDSSEEGVSELAARKLRLVADDDGEARLTLAGVLLCTREPQRWLSHAYVQAVSYAGERTDIDYQTDARDIGGPLDEQVAEACTSCDGTCWCVPRRPPPVQSARSSAIARSSRRW